MISSLPANYAKAEDKLLLRLSHIRLQSTAASHMTAASQKSRWQQIH
jgi:hypothetical protein